MLTYDPNADIPQIINPDRITTGEHLRRQDERDKRIDKILEEKDDRDIRSNASEMASISQESLDELGRRRREEDELDTPPSSSAVATVPPISKAINALPNSKPPTTIATVVIKPPEPTVPADTVARSTELSMKGICKLIREREIQIEKELLSKMEKVKSKELELSSANERMEFILATANKLGNEIRANNSIVFDRATQLNAVKHAALIVEERIKETELKCDKNYVKLRDLEDCLDRQAQLESKLNEDLQNTNDRIINGECILNELREIETARILSEKERDEKWQNIIHNLQSVRI